MFMPESHHMAQFMHHDTKLVAVLSNRDGLGVLLLVNNVDPPRSTDIQYYYLRSVASLPHKTTAATRTLSEDCKHNFRKYNPTN